MVKFRISLKLYNYLSVTSSKYSLDKIKKIHKFYKTIDKLLKSIHNYNVRKLQKECIDYYEPLIKIQDINFRKPKSSKDKNIDILFNIINPPSIHIDISFKMSSKIEEAALKQFYTNYKGSIRRKSYIELKELYYSSKIINFVNKLRYLISDNTLWKCYRKIYKLKTKYKPIITLGETTVLSLN